MYTRDQKAIFPYFDGVKDRKGDPLVLRSRLLKHPELEQEIKLANLNSKPLEAAEATSRLVALVRDVFKLPEFNDETGEGLTSSEALAVLGDFVQWMEELLGEPKPSQTSLPSAAGQFSDTEANSPTTAQS